MLQSNSKILILGRTGLLGSALVRLLEQEHFTNILAPARDRLELSDQKAVLHYFYEHRPEFVINAAAKVGGIQANNTKKADFIFENLSIQNNVFEAAFKTKVSKLLFIGSSCMYPRDCPQPIKEEYLLTGPIEKTNEPFAVAKLAGLKMAESFREQYGMDFFTVISNGIYGPGDHFHPHDSHVIAGLMTRMRETLAKGEANFEIWGTGHPRREFLYVDDVAAACLFLLRRKEKLPWSYLNLGPEENISIGDLAKLIGKLMGFKGEYRYNTQYPDGSLNKFLDSSRIKKLGWKQKISFEQGLKKTIDSFLSQADNATPLHNETKVP